MDEPRPARHPFDRLRARGLLAQLVLIAVAAMGVVLGVRVRGHAPALTPHDVRVGTLVVYAAALVLILARGWRAGLDWRRLFGDPPSRPLLPLLLVVVPVALLTMAAAIFSYIPLSYLAPRFVEHTLLDDRSLLDVRSFGGWLELVALGVVAAPVVEELLMRGILLQRWARRWGTTAGVVASSALFAVLHGEWVGHFLFGLAMAALYLRTRSLWMPIAAHAVNNGALALLALPAALRPGHPGRTTLSELRGQWTTGLLALAAGGALLWWYLERWWPDGAWRRALRGPVPYEAARAAAGAPGPASPSSADSISAS